MSKLCAICEKWSPWFLSLLRVVIAGLILCHGGQKVFDYPESRLEPPPLLSLAGVAGILELTGGALLLVGLFTRVAAFILSGEMAVAYFMVHFPKAWWPIHNQGELAVIYCFVFLYLAVAGGGLASIDHWWKNRAAASEGRD
jgi:putative oxidoreductase